MSFTITVEVPYLIHVDDRKYGCDDLQCFYKEHVEMHNLFTKAPNVTRLCGSGVLYEKRRRTNNGKCTISDNLTSVTSKCRPLPDFCLLRLN